MSANRRAAGSGRTFSLTLAMALAATGAQASDKTAQATIYSGGPILTMVGDAPETVEAVAVKDGRILAAGTLASVRKTAGKSAAIVDLAGKSLLPGFIDAHGHVSLLGRFKAMADVSSPPVGDVTTIGQLQAKLRAYAAAHPEGPIVGRGYDDAALAEGRHPTRQDLDAVSTDRPIVLLHVSGHLGTANTAMLRSMGITADTPDPAGGKIRREADGKTPNGVLEEGAMMPLFRTMFPTDPESNITSFKAGLQDYAAHGITTAQDGGVAAMQWPLYELLRQNNLPIDVAVLIMGMDDLPPAVTGQIGGDYKGRIRIVGLKFVLDGSPQGRTAWLTHPYHIAPDGKPADYHGYPAIDLDKFQAKLNEAAKNGWQVFAHVNGDAAAQALIDGVSKAGLSGKRTVAIHNQIVRPEQLEQMFKLDIQPSFFANHTYFWGDWHREVVLGEPRADFISPQATAWRIGLKPTAHNDSPVVPPDMLRLVWSSVNRRTQSGDILGPMERIPVYRALQQVTINAAWQIHEESQKGSIAPGKQADFVVLDRDPLSVDPLKINEIGVVATINDGSVVYGSLK